MNKKFQVRIVLLVMIGIALTWLMAGQRLLAGIEGTGAVPALISFQGLLADGNGDPLADGTYDMAFALYDAAGGGTLIWAETQNGVAVSNGFFAVMLGSGICTSGCPLGADDFTGATRYLQTSVDTGSGLVDFPRQQLASAPYAFQAEQADQANTADHATTADSATTATTADSAPWSGLTSVPPGFADNVDDDALGTLACSPDQIAKWNGTAWDCAPDDAGGSYENVITVATGGGDFTSVADALASITDSSSTNPYLVRVMAGVFTETALVEVKEYVHVQGSGPNATVITSARTGGTPGNGSATVDLLDNGRISNLTVRNSGTGTFGIALYSAESSRAAVVDNVVAEAIGTGGTGHYAAYWNDAEAIIQGSILRASGATGFGTGVNAALGIVNISGGFPQPLIKGSTLIGGNSDVNGLTCAGNTGTGFAIQGTNSSPQVFESYLCGDRRGIFMGTAGNTRLHHSQVWVSSTGGSFMVETTGSATVIIVNSGVFYVGNKYTGAGNFVCVNSYKANYTPATDGTTSGTACN